MIIRNWIRKFFNVRANETFRDGVIRHRYSLEKKFLSNKFKITTKDFQEELIQMGIKKGDILMVHCSWRSLYNYDGTPEELIKMIINLIGDEGTLLMPSFGQSHEYFDVSNTKSKAGVLSEVFRTEYQVLRSMCSHFSVAGLGKNAYTITKDHKHSIFGFDYHSPYYRFSQFKNAKVLNIGMGKYPIKTTLIHCVEYKLSNILDYFSNYLAINYTAKVIDTNGVLQYRNMIKGKKSKLNKRNIKYFYKNLDAKYKKYKKIKNIDIVLIDAYHSLQYLEKLARNGKYMIKILEK